MIKSLLSGAAALPVLLCAAPALAETTDTDIIALGHRADAHGPSGTMADHVHKSGDVMIGVTWMHEEASGANRSGTAPISDAAIVAAGFSNRTQTMTMDMAMFHMMYAPSDRVTLMVMPSWQRMDMTMVAVAPSVHDGHALAVGDTTVHRVAGFGDTQVGALVALSRRAALSAHAGLAVSIPTGSASRKDDDGNFVHYGMQPGSGTWDLLPSFTLRGAAPGFGWGTQVSYVFRAQKKNASGFRFGDRLVATGWLSKPITPRASLSARMTYTSEGQVRGHYNAGHNHASPPDRQANYGGERIDGALGANLVIGENLRLGIEGTVPLYQRLNGIQAPRRFATSLNVSRMF
jgi:hypothetical protein